MVFPGWRNVAALTVFLVFIDLSWHIASAEVVYCRMAMLPGDKLFWKTGL